MTQLPHWYTGPHAGFNNRTKTKRTKRKAPEHRFQVSLVKVLRRYAQIFTWHSIPNGGYRHLHTAVKLKAEGALAGVPDLVFVLPPEGRTAYLELKAPKGSLSPGQKQFRDNALKSGALWESAKNIDEAYGILSAWGVLPQGFGLQQTTHQAT